MRTALVALLVTCSWIGGARALDAELRHGKLLLQRMCGRCHAVGRTGASPDRLAPPFRTFGDDKLYDENFVQRLQDGLSTIHPDMPAFRFEREDAEAAVNYIKAIQARRKAK